MGDLAIDTAVRAGGDGLFEATLSRDWEIWGPMGGYVAACALRAAGASTPELRPAAFSCNYLSVAQFAPVDIRVSTRKRGRTVVAQRVEMTQGERSILDAMVWSVGEVEGLEHDETIAPAVTGPEHLASVEELLPDDAQPPFPFWNNLDEKPLEFENEWPPDGPRTAEWKAWLRFRPTASFDDPWVDAARCVILVDLPSWPSANRPHAWKQPGFMAPTLDLNVAFHQPTRGHEWLLCDGAAPLSTGGLFGWTARVWSTGGRLHASGGGQCLYRRMPG
ncbi:MAG: acyl-CoA thioesterase [Actinomycetota bacterium]|nr:acyl-CoA thioesterase [Actinomycetota bacterium]